MARSFDQFTPSRQAVRRRSRDSSVTSELRLPIMATRNFVRLHFGVVSHWRLNWDKFGPEACHCGLWPWFRLNGFWNSKCHRCHWELYETPIREDFDHFAVPIVWELFLQCGIIYPAKRPFALLQELAFHARRFRLVSDPLRRFGNWDG